MEDLLYKPEFYFMTGYRPELNRTSPTRHYMTTCFSDFHRYKNQEEIISEMMKTKMNGPLRVFDVGISEGQEPLTHINSAWNLVKGTDRTISNVLDLTMTDILKETQFSKRASISEISPVAITHLKNLYRDPQKTHFETPFETLVDSMLASSKKQDVVLFNNVIQHMNFTDPKQALSSIEKLIKLVDKDGIFCFAVEDHMVRQVQDRVDGVKELLKKMNFEEISKGIYKLAK